jgi:hypothetical protein
MSKNEIFKQIRKRHFPKEISPILDLLEENAVRVEFVKESVGLQDVLFISELDAKEFIEEPFYTCFNVNIDPENEEYNFISMKKSKNTSIEHALDSLHLFFKNTTRVLYVWIAFKESSLEQKDMFLVYERIQTRQDTHIYEAKAKVRKFPDWFKAKLPSEIMEEKKYLHLLEQLQDELNFKLKEELMNSINSAAIENNEEAFLKLGKIYQKMYQKDL